ncbi:DUF2332 family protein [Piscinibacter aquaticus]|uniref:DUF2332 family protein n=1 Tax=Piscinibacter aquaticus TaxID=392597 RepID=A0A5C6U0Z3_9BURK|nr:DUF2332 family protein [Piscinibacter aquaticus]
MGDVPSDAPSHALIDAFREQVRWCDRLGSPFNARADRMDGRRLAGRRADACAAAGLDGRAARAGRVPLRPAGAFHALALSGRHLQLSHLYPPAAAAFDAQALHRCCAGCSSTKPITSAPTSPARRRPTR